MSFHLVIAHRQFITFDLIAFGVECNKCDNVLCNNPRIFLMVSFKRANLSAFRTIVRLVLV